MAPRCLYEITVQGRIGASLAGVLAGFDLVASSERGSRFRGWVADQDELHRTLRQLSSLGIALERVQVIERKAA